MRRALLTPLNDLLNSTQALGVGLLDANGLLIEGCGAHDGGSAAELAVFLAHIKRQDLEQFLGNDLDEQILIGAEYVLFVRWLLGGKYLLYLLLPADTMRGSVRQALKKAATDIHDLLASDLIAPLRERLEQPRQFVASGTPRQGLGRFIKKS